MIIPTLKNPRDGCVFAVTGIVLLCLGTPATAKELSYLPSLGNSDPVDHALSREVDDEHVFSGPIGAIPDTATEESMASVIPAFSTIADESSSGSVIWDSIQRSSVIPLTDSPKVQEYKEAYLQQAHFTNQKLERSRPFIAHLVKALDERYLPVELALLPAIESGYQPNVVSLENAVGLWQIVPITAREIGIQRTRWVDGRADIQVATTAAIDYLSFLNAEFDGDWELTLAAYNAGPGRVRRAIRENVAKDEPTDFYSLRLPKETRNYVPKFVALLTLIKDTNNNAIELPQVSAETAFEQTDIGTRVSLDKLAEVTGINEKTLALLNTGLIHGVTPPEGPHTVYVPRGQATAVKAKLAGVDPSTLFQIPSHHTVVAGDTLGGIALRYGMTLRQLQVRNRLDSDKIRVGQKLSVVDSRFIIEPKLVNYVVGAGDTLSGIAAKHSVSVSAVTNHDGKALVSDVIRPGDKLLIRIGSPSGS